MELQEYADLLFDGFLTCRELTALLENQPGLLSNPSGLRGWRHDGENGDPFFGPLRAFRGFATLIASVIGECALNLDGWADTIGEAVSAGIRRIWRPGNGISGIPLTRSTRLRRSSLS
jgi:hypothetical protein